jgi:hypothetical protein
MGAVMSHIAARVFAVLREDRPYELKDTEGKSINVLAAKGLIMARYRVPEDIRQERRKSKGRKRNAAGLQKEGTAVGREHEAAIAPQPVVSLPSPVS